jgi:hypothetical protein
MKELVILIEYYLYTTRTTIGKLYFQYIKNFVQQPLVVSKDFFCYTLGDTSRPNNIKVYGETCLPGGLKCKVSLFENDHYKKTLIIHTEDDKRTIKFFDLTWTDCLFHNGVTFADTDACVLVGKTLIPPVYVNNRITQEPTIQDGMKDALRVFIEQKMKEGYTITTQFVNLTQLT